MTSLNEALRIISNLPFEYKKTYVNINKSLGYVLCEDVCSDVNMPPFDKSAMDGYACKRADISKELRVIDTIPAGSEPKSIITDGTCAKIMTGAKVPEGANIIIKIEDTTPVADGIIKFTGKNTKSNICYLGEDVIEGEKVLSEGDFIKPSTMAVLASVGKTEVNVYKPPVVSLIATGDELVEPDNIPDKARIRNSNAYNLMGQLSQNYTEVNYWGIVNDNINDIKKTILSAIAQSDLVILTGGVSMGDRDFVPGVLKDEGFSIHFDKLSIQPGRPVVFASKGNKYCFALSGNPVSSMLQFELLVRPFLYHFMHYDYCLPIIKTVLVNSISRKKTERQQFFPVKIVNGKAEIIEFHGSSHILSLHYADGFGFFPVGVKELHYDTVIDVLFIK